MKDAAKTFRLEHAYLRRLRTAAARAGKQGVIVVQFPDMVVECRILPLRSAGD